MSEKPDSPMRSKRQDQSIVALLERPTLDKAAVALCTPRNVQNHGRLAAASQEKG